MPSYINDLPICREFVKHLFVKERKHYIQILMNNILSTCLAFFARTVIFFSLYSMSLSQLCQKTSLLQQWKTQVECYT